MSRMPPPPHRALRDANGNPAYRRLQHLQTGGQNEIFCATGIEGGAAVAVRTPRFKEGEPAAKTARRHAAFLRGIALQMRVGDAAVPVIEVHAEDRPAAVLAWFSGTADSLLLSRPVRDRPHLATVVLDRALAGLEVVHAAGIVHGDTTLLNLLYRGDRRDPECRWADFDTSTDTAIDASEGLGRAHPSVALPRRWYLLLKGELDGTVGVEELQVWDLQVLAASARRATIWNPGREDEPHGHVHEGRERIPRPLLDFYDRLQSGELKTASEARIELGEAARALRTIGGKKSPASPNEPATPVRPRRRILMPVAGLLAATALYGACSVQRARVQQSATEQARTVLDAFDGTAFGRSGEALTAAHIADPTVSETLLDLQVTATEAYESAPAAPETALALGQVSRQVCVLHLDTSSCKPAVDVLQEAQGAVASRSAARLQEHLAFCDLAHGAAELDRDIWREAVSSWTATAPEDRGAALRSAARLAVANGDRQTALGLFAQSTDAGAPTRRGDEILASRNAQGAGALLCRTDVVDDVLVASGWTRQVWRACGQLEIGRTDLAQATFEKALPHLKPLGGAAVGACGLPAGTRRRLRALLADLETDPATRCVPQTLYGAFK